MPNGDHGYSDPTTKYRIRCPTCGAIYINETGTYPDAKVGDIFEIGGLCWTETCNGKFQKFVIIAVGREKIEWDTERHDA